MGKRMVVLSDGTGNSSAAIWRTNLWRTFEALELSNSDQVAFYDDGVGTSSFNPPIDFLSQSKSAAGVADETRLDIGQPHIVAPMAPLIAIERHSRGDRSARREHQRRAFRRRYFCGRFIPYDSADQGGRKR